MSATINDGKLCVLALNEKSQRIEVQYRHYSNPFESSMNRFAQLCTNSTVTLEILEKHIKSSPDFDSLSGEYKYCEDLDGTYQTFLADKNKLLSDIERQRETIKLQAKLSKDFDAGEALFLFKKYLLNLYTKWCKAYAIQKAYRLCHNDKLILSFSHRICGWSNPVHKLTPNFSIELKTNFGYGWSSYFYIKMRYKNIDILPFSHWVQYEHAQFSEIIRYSQKYYLKNEEWIKALDYSEQACNLSLFDETKFVEKYIIGECELMAKGLENLFSDEIKAKNKAGQLYKLDKRGYPLTEFRGEKISGALDFIVKMMEFEKIASVKSFISRIEDCCKRIHPILKAELLDLKPKIEKAEQAMDALKPIYNSSLAKERAYNSTKNEIKHKLALKNKITHDQVDITELNKLFKEKCPEYYDFSKEHSILLKKYFSLDQEIKNLTSVFNSISNYTNKITYHFH